MKKIVFIGSFLILLFLSSCTNHSTNTKVEPAWNLEDKKIAALGQQKPIEVVQKMVYEKKEPAIYSVKMRVVGDIMTHKWQFQAAYNFVQNTYDFSTQFALVKPFLQEADFTLGNLETTFGGEESGYSGYPRFNTPDSLGKSLKEAGFDLVTTSNNHSMDTNSKGVIRTLDILDKIGIEHIGTYRSQVESEQIKIKKINNISFAFLSYTYGTNGIPVPKEQSYLVNLIDIQKMKNDIKRAEALSPDFIVIGLHFGQEYQKYPNENQKILVDQLFEAGADIILGGHPHVLQPMETRKITDSDGTEKTGFVIYSLGNFISSQRTPLDPPRDAGIILNLDFEKIENQKAKLKEVSIMPTWVQFGSRDGKRLIRVLGSKLSDETKAELSQQEINRIIDIKEYTLFHMLGEDKIKEDENFYRYPFD